MDIYTTGIFLAFGSFDCLCLHIYAYAVTMCAQVPLVIVMRITKLISGGNSEVILACCCTLDFFLAATIDKRSHIHTYMV